MVRNAKTGGTNNLPQPAMTLEEAVRFYGWEHLAPGTQQCRWYTLRRFDLLGLKPGEAERPTLYGKHNTKRRDASILNKVFGFDFYVPNAEPHRYELPTDEQLSRALGRKHGLYTALMAYAGLRVGEACAMDRSYLKGNFIDVHALATERTHGCVKASDTCEQVNEAEGGFGHGLRLGRETDSGRT